MVGRRLTIRWSRRALDSLYEGLAYIARFNPEAARNIRGSILEALDYARAFPEATRMVPEEGNPRIREVLREPFRIIYEIPEREIHVLVVRRMERSPLEEGECGST